jgi:PAS domain S-box-containing protein
MNIGSTRLKRWRDNVIRSTATFVRWSRRPLAMGAMRCRILFEPSHPESPQIECSLYYAIERARLQNELEKHPREITSIQTNLLKIMDKNADAIVIAAAPDSRILFINPAAASLLDRRKKDLLNRPFSFPLAGSKVSEIEISHRSKGKITAEMRVVEIEWEGQPAYLASLRDITQRKKTKEALKRSEEKYRDLISTSKDGIISTDSRMHVIIWNQGAERIFGYTEKEMLGQPVTKIVPERDHEKTQQMLSSHNKAGAAGSPDRIIEGYGLRKDGKEIPIELSVSSRKYEENFITTAIIRDVTERKEAEAKLREIDRMKSEFLSNVSHELRTPLQSITGFTRLIMNGQVPDPATQQEFYQIINRETQHLGNLINGLLDLSRLESGRFQINRQPAAIRDTLLDSIRSFHTLARDKNITLDEEIPEELPEMEIDDERMRQVFVNLLSNAVKYSNSGGSVTVRAEKRPHELVFQVSDRGIGMSPETVKHLFERFYRAEDKNGRGGTGLGLYITRQIVEAHRGHIWVESRPGEGSTFSFNLPLNGKGGDGHGV